jgi:hypothetical protein
MKVGLETDGLKDFHGGVDKEIIIFKKPEDP